MYLGDEEESFRNEKKVKKKSTGSVCPASVSSGSWQCTQIIWILSQINRIGEICRYVEWSGNTAKTAQLLIQVLFKLCEFEEELATSTRAVVGFKDDMSVVQSPKKLNKRVFQQKPTSLLRNPSTEFESYRRVAKK